MMWCLAPNNVSSNNIVLPQPQPQQQLPPGQQHHRADRIRQPIHPLDPLDPLAHPPAITHLFNTIDSASLLDVDSEIKSKSASSSPQSVIGQFPSSTLDSTPAASTPRSPQNGTFKYLAPAAQSQLLPAGDMMYTDQLWLGDGCQFTPRSSGRTMHQRHCSLSSLGSTGPASPFSYNSANPQIAINDSGDNYPGFSMSDDQSYQLVAKAPNLRPNDTLYANMPCPSDTTSLQAYASILAPARHTGDRNGLLPPPDFPSGPSAKSRPMSVASSVASDSPATPAAPEPDNDQGGRKSGAYGLAYSASHSTHLVETGGLFGDTQLTQLTTVPKLDRTMTDICSDELYSPNYNMASMSPSQPLKSMLTSPSSEMFVQRVQAANTQHMSTTQSPLSAVSGGRSPFRNGSPLAPALVQDFPPSSVNQMRLNKALAVRERRKMELDCAQALRQTMAHASSAGTPQTTSPHDALLELNDGDGDGDGDNSSNFTLFPQKDTTGLDASQVSKTACAQSNNFARLSLAPSADNYLAPQPSCPRVPLPQQYPFVAKPARPSSSMSSAAARKEESCSLPARVHSQPSATPDSVVGCGPTRPDAAGADGGTYTCTYHGCTMRFETPALLQKHKREGHRQVHGLIGLRRPEPTTTTDGFFNTQSGPHKCERINPSTGKPCNTVFSRPYDLTRHEDTIHNARKQKVRCGVCTEEKTFSRADALTRHYRVCHPDLEFPGKHRRRPSGSVATN